MGRMLLLAKRNQYGVWAIFDIAYHGGGVRVPIDDIAARQRIHKAYLPEILRMLKMAGMVEGEPGPKAGFRLSREPHEITVCDIIDCLGGPVELVPCLPQSFDRERNGAFLGEREEQLIWKEMEERIVHILKQKTIQDLCRRAEEIGIERTSTASPS
jgi:Rrf2 family iron-sulfur cluster assembly transcriptional regulator